MAKPKTAYVCAECGAHSVKWAGQCADCAAWNTLSEMRIAGAAPVAASATGATGLDALQLDPEERYATGFVEFDRVLGGGLVPGAVVLLGGDPGVGKSTLLQQVSGQVQAGMPVLYATGEESLRQVSQRARRLAVANDGLKVLADTALENVLAEARRNQSRMLIIDSIQTMTSSELTSAPGSVGQLRECVGRIVQFAKQNEVSVFVIGHVTKEGAIAGPRVVEHMVDTVLYFENDPASRYTMIRSVKNRFGATGEMGVFAMTGSGFREVRNPSAIFLSRDTLTEPGSVVSIAWEGSRALLVEMQALVADGGGGYPKRVAQGVDQNRLSLLLAVLQRHGDVQLGPEDVFVNVVGGLKITETAADLPTVLSVVSSFRDRPCRGGLVSFGEIGLAGEVRPVRYGEERIAAAAKQGFSCVIVPRSNAPRKAPAGIDVIAVTRIREALDAAF
jgi:DNA repair protein RadA/Sms